MFTMPHTFQLQNIVKIRITTQQQDSMVINWSNVNQMFVNLLITERTLKIKTLG